MARKVCCDGVNRGVAAWRDKIFVGPLDGRLIALHARDGRVAWSTMTVNPEEPYTITGAPRVIRGKVIIETGGAEYGVRGYVDAYDAETGTRLWRFHTVPGNPADGFENSTMERIAETWNGEYVWHYQVVPAETWDYTATQHMILAEIEWKGRLRKVLMQANSSRVGWWRGTQEPRRRLGKPPTP